MMPFGAILAGGQSRRYGAPKALAPIGGVRIIDRVIDALSAVAPDLVLIANEPALFEDIDLPQRSDLRQGAGALGGIHAALAWAREAGRPGVVAVACDMPFLSPPLLTRIRDEAFGDAGGPAVVVPESDSRRGVEPLCAAYRIDALPAIEAQLDEGDPRMIGFHHRVRVRRIPRQEVARLCEPGLAFLNVNTREERDRAEALLEARHGG